MRRFTAKANDQSSFRGKSPKGFTASSLAIQIAASISMSRTAPRGIPALRLASATTEPLSISAGEWDLALGVLNAGKIQPVLPPARSGVNFKAWLPCPLLPSALRRLLTFSAGAPKRIPCPRDTFGEIAVLGFA